MKVKVGSLVDQPHLVCTGKCDGEVLLKVEHYQNQQKVILANLKVSTKASPSNVPEQDKKMIHLLHAVLRVAVAASAITARPAGRA